MSSDDKFNALYRRFYTRMLRFFLSSFHLSEEDARDLTQDTFLRVHRGLDEYRGDAAWAYVEKIARNVAYNAFRSRNTQKRGALVSSLDDAMSGNAEPSKEPTIEKDIDARRQRELIAAALKTLPMRQRQCVGLWLEGHQYSAIARVLRISDDAVKSALRDAKRELRQKLGAQLPEEDQ